MNNHYTKTNSPDVIKIMHQGIQLENQGSFEEAINCYKQALRHRPSNLDIHIHIAVAALQSGNSQLAKSHFNKVIQIDRDNITAQAGIANILEREGWNEKAYHHILPLVDKAPLNLNVLLTFSRICRHFQLYDKSISLLENALANNIAAETEKHWVHFALGDLYDAKGSTSEAFAHYKSANELKHASFDEWEHARNIDRLINVYTNDFMQRAPISRKRKKGFSPVFVIGVPRSGTSLVEQILASHPKVHGGGELTYISDLVGSVPVLLNSGTPYPECMSDITRDAVNTLSKDYANKAAKLMNPGENWMTDKLPGNFLHLGFIELLLPRARIVHCKRDPLDTCLSCYFNDFSSPHMGYSCDLGKLGAYYHLYEKLMKHWKSVLKIKVLDVEYEDLLVAPEENIRALLDFCGLKWNRKCLEFYKNTRQVRTASYNQVRKPLYTSSIERWKAYDKYLGPLKDALNRDLSVFPGG